MKLNYENKTLDRVKVHGFSQEAESFQQMDSQRNGWDPDAAAQEPEMFAEMLLQKGTSPRTRSEVR